MWMNQADIEWAHETVNDRACPNVRKAIRLLYRLMEAVNAQSDGWPYWRAPSKAADKLMDLIQGAGRSGSISDAELRGAITPIKTMVTRQRKLQARFGNTFDFNVDG